eukprot:CAMPEP_0197296488 /NCGR_PEP_ID=MMETSP0890-20130614/38487_1 /TAXON_ID=44058 ORGANISM="Aureoumbra lagunensis, Strain CCMP1510" /NCGR_SAMPLE_ID=MMETSP0890 /ASSEMBLY_ACC=CAM_ASM_000533 /LENGTH=180 /DNA_ID=CAMNT_0042773055 /DNA_START=69 /DNA_END=611 /DNA_ORIENTATION=+
MLLYVFPRACRCFMNPITGARASKLASRLSTTIRSNSFEIEGSLIEINDIESFNSGNSKREFVIRTAETYAQDIKFDLWNDRTNLVDDLDIDTRVIVSFNIKGKKNEQYNRYFNNLNAWRVQKLSQKSDFHAQSSMSPDFNKIPEEDHGENDDDSDDYSDQPSQSHEVGDKKKDSDPVPF